MLSLQRHAVARCMTGGLLQNCREVIRVKWL
jgi:hypothetical protein